MMMTSILATPALVSVLTEKGAHPSEGFRMTRVATSNGYYCRREPAIRIFATYQAVFVADVGHYEVQ